MEFKMNYNTFKVRSEVGLVLLRVSPTQRNTTPVPVACASIPCGRFSNHLIKTFSLTREKFRTTTMTLLCMTQPTGAPEMSHLA